MSYHGWRYNRDYKRPLMVFCNGIRVRQVLECFKGQNGWVRYLPSAMSIDDVVDGVYGEMFGNVEVIDR